MKKSIIISIIAGFIGAAIHANWAFGIVAMYIAMYIYTVKLFIHNEQKKCYADEMDWLMAILIAWVWPISFFVMLTSRHVKKKVKEDLGIDGQICFRTPVYIKK